MLFGHEISEGKEVINGNPRIAGRFKHQKLVIYSFHQKGNMVKIRICEKPLHFRHDTFVFEQNYIEGISHKKDLIVRHPFRSKVVRIVARTFWWFFHYVLTFFAFAIFVIFHENTFKYFGFLDAKELDCDLLGIFFLGNNEIYNFVCFLVDLKVGFPEFNEKFYFLILVVSNFEDLHF